MQENTTEAAKAPPALNKKRRPWALVTGASAGIGKEFARQLAGKGYALVLVARREDRLRELAQTLEQEHGTACHVVAADLSDPAASETIVTALDAAGIEIEFLVNNAGYGVPGKLVAVPLDTHDTFMQVMVNAVIELCWRLMPGMIERERGFIINVASVAGIAPSSAGHTLYGASKAFLIKFSESLAAEGAPHGVHVSALCPGFTYSEFHDVTGTRDQVNQLPSWLWLQAEDVVRDGIDAVTREKPRVVEVPGGIWKFIVWLSGAAPGFGRWLANRNAHRFRKMD
ncbi:MAG: SDR family oxidoreductase [Pseudomonadota bacterium]